MTYPSSPANRPPTFTIHFPDGRFAPAVQVKQDDDPQMIIDLFNLLVPCPALFISGGAGSMTPEDITATRDIIADGIAEFAEQHKLAVVDGGTDSGVMQMLGQVRRERRYRFPLIGVAPIGRVSYPGHESPDHDAILHEGHSHFVLVEGNDWGDESQMLVDMVRKLSRSKPSLGILINGGNIAEKDVYIATTQGENSIPMIVLEGSGRKADEIATALSTGETESKIIKAIISGGRITVASIKAGATALRERLMLHFDEDAELADSTNNLAIPDAEDAATISPLSASDTSSQSLNSGS
ncbi:MAG: hypothetical protein KC708_25750 [Anaerolineae bacterium]|nr:hypothetical protein [Anaerolineae bacterium]